MYEIITQDKKRLVCNWLANEHGPLFLNKAKLMSLPVRTAGRKKKEKKRERKKEKRKFKGFQKKKKKKKKRRKGKKIATFTTWLHNNSNTRVASSLGDSSLGKSLLPFFSELVSPLCRACVCVYCCP